MSENEVPRDVPPGDAEAEPTSSPAGADAAESARSEPDDQSETHEEDSVRRHSWPCSGPAELDLEVEVGRIDVTLSDEASAVEVELRAEPGAAGGWHKGLAGVLNWLNEASGGSGSIRLGGREFPWGGRGFPFGGGPFGGGEFNLGPGWHFDPRELVGRDFLADAVRAAEMSWSEVGRRLLVRSARTLPSRLVPLVVTVRAPAGSRVLLRTGVGQLSVTGTAGTVDARSGSGDIELDTVTGDLRLRSGSGSVTARSVSGRTKAKTGSGTIELDTVTGPADVQSGSGDLRLGVVRADLLARTGSGDVTISDAETGRLDLTAGSGNLRVGVHQGVAAELDLRSGSGRARSELAVADTAPPGEATLRIYGQTGSGDVLVTRALSATGAAG